ncbi:hypothetical protein JCM15831A_07710 [Asaia astilbis]
MLEKGHVEPCKMHQLDDVLIGEEGFEVRAVLIATTERFWTDLDKMRFAVARRELYEAKTVAVGIEAHGFGIDSNDRTQIEIIGEVSIVEMDGCARCCHDA